MLQDEIQIVRSGGTEMVVDCPVEKGIVFVVVNGVGVVNVYVVVFVVFVSTGVGR